MCWRDADVLRDTQRFSLTIRRIFDIIIVSDVSTRMTTHRVPCILCSIFGLVYVQGRCEPIGLC